MQMHNCTSSASGFQSKLPGLCLTSIQSPLACALALTEFQGAHTPHDWNPSNLAQATCGRRLLMCIYAPWLTFYAPSISACGAMGVSTQEDPLMRGVARAKGRPGRDQCLPSQAVASASRASMRLLLHHRRLQSCYGAHIYMHACVCAWCQLALNTNAIAAAVAGCIKRQALKRAPHVYTQPAVEVAHANATTHPPPTAVVYAPCRPGWQAHPAASTSSRMSTWPAAYA